MLLQQALATQPDSERDLLAQLSAPESTAIPERLRIAALEFLTAAGGEARLVNFRRCEFNRRLRRKSGASGLLIESEHCERNGASHRCLPVLFSHSPAARGLLI